MTEETTKELTIKPDGDILEAAKLVEEIRAKLTVDQKNLLKSTVAKGATDDELALFMHVAQSRGLNPFNRQIHFVKRKTSNADGTETETGVHQTGIDGFRLIADRTGTYSPSSKTTIYEYRGGNLHSATAFVMKFHKMSNTWVEFSATVLFSEFSQKTKAGALTRFWREMGHTMLEKCAEAKAIRKGWPEETSGLYTPEEMMQADKPSEPASVIQGEYKELPAEASVEQSSPAPHDYCAIHQDIPWGKKTGQNRQVFYSHLDPFDDKKWCNKSKVDKMSDAELQAGRSDYLAQQGGVMPNATEKEAEPMSVPLQSQPGTPQGFLASLLADDEVFKDNIAISVEALGWKKPYKELTSILQETFNVKSSLKLDIPDREKLYKYLQSLIDKKNQ